MTGLRRYPRPVPTEEELAHGDGRRDLVSEPQPDIRPLGFIAVGLAVLSFLLAPSYFFSLYAYLAAAPALALGFIARTDEAIRKLGTAAVALALVASIVASVVLVLQ
jgi:hypothetical protein